ncbi:MAG: FtsX-like permease family protein [Gammaproteobacteria bacterium]|nr:FtsX-like permease family protein [Gammaproteobacteria bacterium]
MHLVLTGWRMLVYSPRRLLLSCLGIAFAVVIMFMQMGFFNGLNDSQANLARILDADLVMSHRDKDNLKSTEEFSRKRWRQALAAPGVASGAAVYASASYWWNPQDGSRNRVLVLGIDPDNPGLRLPQAAGFPQSLKRADTIFYDRRSRRELGNILPGMESTLGQARVKVAGLFDLGANFSYEGHVIAGNETYFHVFGHRDPQRLTDGISLGLLRLLPGADREGVRRNLLHTLPDDVLVLTREELEARERAYTTRATPVGIIFGTGLAVALVIGIIICYQLLFNEIQDHLRQFATLKAIGYRARHLYLIVTSEALLLSMFGFLPGVVAAAALYTVVERLSEIVMDLSPGRILFVLMLTLVMGSASAAFAVRQVIRLDPAELF